MYAVDDLQDAVPVTKRYFGALELRGWLKLGVVVFVLTGVGGMEFTYNAPVGLGTLADAAGDETLLLVGGGALTVYLGFQYLAAISEFVFLESLRSSELHVRRYARANLKRGGSLLALRVALLTAPVVPVGALVLATGSSPTDVDVEAIVSVLEANLGLAVLGGVGAVVGWWTANTLTTAFVTPIILQEDRGPIGAVGRFASAMGSNLTGTAAFLAVAWLIGFAVWTALSFLGFFVMIFGIIAVILVAELGSAIHPSLDALGLVVLVGGLLCYQYAVALLEAPVKAYVRSFALLLLGDTDPTLDLIPEERRAVRDGRAGRTRDVTRVAWADDRRESEGTSRHSPRPGEDRHGEFGVDFDDGRSERDDWNDGSDRP